VSQAGAAAAAAAAGRRRRRRRLCQLLLCECDLLQHTRLQQQQASLHHIMALLLTSIFQDKVCYPENTCRTKT